MASLIRNLTRHGFWQRPSAVTLAGIFCVVAMLPYAQVAQKPLSKDEVIRLLKGDVSPKRVAELVQQRGINFGVTPDVEHQLRELGATDLLLATLKESAPQGAATVPLPAAGGLWWVYVKTVTLSKEEAKSRFGLLDSELSADGRYTLIDHLDERSDATRSGVRGGDYIKLVIPPGDELGKTSNSVSSEADFYRLAARCSPDCILSINHAEDLPSGSKAGFLLVGKVGTHFELVHNPMGFEVSLKDKFNGQLYYGLIGADVFQRQLEIMRNAPPGPMAPAEATPTPSGNQSIVTVQNTSPNLLTFIFSGSAVRKLEVAPGNSETFKLPPGDYEIASMEMYSTQIGKDTYLPNMQYRFAYPQSGFLGLRVASITESVKRRLPKGNTGVVVSEVARGTPAEAAGISAGDVIRDVVTADGPTVISDPSDFDRVAIRCTPDCLITVWHLTYKGYEFSGYLPIGSIGSNFFPLYGYCAKRVIAYLQGSGSKRGQRYEAGNVLASALNPDDFGAQFKALGRHPSVPGAFITQNLTCSTTNATSGRANSN